MRPPDNGNWDGDETALLGCGLFVALIVAVISAVIVTAVLS